jgi:SAM-dependent methyltransferase
VRVGAIAEGPIERVLLAFDGVPRPLAETILPLVLARALMAATRWGVFDALARGSVTAGKLSRRCAMDATATTTLLEALEAAGYVARDRNGRWSNSRAAARWLTGRRGTSIRDYVLFCYHEWGVLEHLEEFLRTGRSLAIHKSASATAGFWEAYVRGMRALASLAADEIARRVPLRRGARRLLDVGGAHGEYARALCLKYPRLIGEVLDLAPAVKVGRRLAGSDGRGNRLRFRAGDALRVRLPRGRFDGCLVVNLLHHFDERDGRRLVKRLAAALTPGGVIAIVDAFRPPNGRPMSQMEGLLSLHFRLTSAAALPLEADVTAWLRDGGLVPRASIRLRRAPGATLLLAERER